MSSFSPILQEVRYITKIKTIFISAVNFSMGGWVHRHDQSHSVAPANPTISTQPTPSRKIFSLTSHFPQPSPQTEKIKKTDELIRASTLSSSHCRVAFWVQRRRKKAIDRESDFFFLPGRLLPSWKLRNAAASSLHGLSSSSSDFSMTFPTTSTSPSSTKRRRRSRGAGDGFEPCSQWQQCWVLRHEPQVLV